MTDELLSQANNLKARICQVKTLLDSLDLRDPSGIDTTNRISPVMIQAGMAQTIQFDATDINVPNPSQIQVLDAEVHKQITNLLKEYKRRLETMFKDLK